MAGKAEALERPGTPLLPPKSARARRPRALARPRGRRRRRAQGPRRCVLRRHGSRSPARRPRPREPPRPEPRPAPTPRAASTAVREIDLRGMRVEEAERHLAREIDQCLRAGCASVRVIHGFGTGVLGIATAAFLRKHPQVSHSRSGKAEEGGGGVLVVTFKGEIGRRSMPGKAALFRERESQSRRVERPGAAARSAARSGRRLGAIDCQVLSPSFQCFSNSGCVDGIIISGRNSTLITGSGVSVVSPSSGCASPPGRPRGRPRTRSTSTPRPSSARTATSSGISCG